MKRIVPLGVRSLVGQLEDEWYLVIKVRKPESH